MIGNAAGTWISGAVSGPPASSSRTLASGPRRAGGEDATWSRLRRRCSQPRSAPLLRMSLDAEPSGETIPLSGHISNSSGSARMARTTWSACTGRPPGRWMSTWAGSGACSTCATAAPGRTRRLQRIGLWHADLSHCSRRGRSRRSRSSSRRTAYDSSTRVPLGVVPRSPGRAQAGERRAARAPLGGGGRPRSPPREGREHPRHAVRIDRLTEAYAELAPTPPSITTPGSCTSSCPPTSTCRISTRRSGWSRGRTRVGGLAIDTWHMAKLGITPDDLRRVPRATSVGRAERRPLGEHADPIDEVVNHRELPGEGEFRSAGTSPPAATPATRARGASRSSRRSCAAFRSSRSSTVPTRRRAHSSRADEPVWTSMRNGSSPAAVHAPSGAAGRHEASTRIEGSARIDRGCRRHRPHTSADPGSGVRGAPAARRVGRPHRLDVRDGADHRPDLRLHVRLDGGLRRAPARLAPDEVTSVPGSRTPGRSPPG